jgi:hypothetical protein
MEFVLLFVCRDSYEYCRGRSIFGSIRVKLLLWINLAHVRKSLKTFAGMLSYLISAKHVSMVYAIKYTKKSNRGFL